MLDKTLPHGEVVGFGFRVYSQGGHHYDSTGRRVRVLPGQIVDGEQTYVCECIEVEPVRPEDRKYPYPDVPGEAAAPLSFKGCLGTPGEPADPAAPVEHSWGMLNDEVLKSALVTYGEKWTDRDDAINFLESQGRKSNDVDT
jgi:hypothetical protein